LLFLVIGGLTIPKIAPRMHRLFTQRDARAEIARKQAGQSAPAPEEIARSPDLLLIAAVTMGGGLALLLLGYAVLRRLAAVRDRLPGAQDRQE
jgi:hypothetical protein